jgi:hypothetical protein
MRHRVVHASAGRRASAGGGETATASASTTKPTSLPPKKPEPVPPKQSKFGTALLMLVLLAGSTIASSATELRGARETRALISSVVHAVRKQAAQWLPGLRESAQQVIDRAVASLPEVGGQVATAPRRLLCVWTRGARLQFLPQQALPQMPEPCTGGVARGATGEDLADPLFPRGVHSAA